MMIFVVILIAGFCVAYANGANDNFKGVATLFGSGTTSFRRALIWATVTTFLGSIAALLLAGNLIKSFSGKGLVDDAIAAQPVFAAAVALGAGLTVLLATRIGMPVSTTHVSCGSLFGIGAVTGQAHKETIAKILLAWFVTLPVAAGLAAVSFWVLKVM